MEKPKICEVLGVDPWEEFWYRCKGIDNGPYYVGEYGTVFNSAKRQLSGSELLYMINNPDGIIRNEEQTDDEKAVLRLLKKAGYNRVKKGERKITLDYGCQSSSILSDILPSMKKGDCFILSEIDLDD